MNPHEFNTLTNLCTENLRLSGVSEGQRVAVLSQGHQRLDYADAFLIAARRLGATSYNVRLADEQPGHVDGVVWTIGITQLAENRPAVEALKAADMVVDLVFLLFSDEQKEVQAAGTRMLLCVEPLDVLARLFPTDDLRHRVEASEEILARARTLHLSNEAGTAVTYELGQYPVLTEYGYTDEAGRWDHWPSGFLFTNGNDGGVNGKVVLAPGDIVIAPFRTYVQDRVDITIEEGQIVDLRGDLSAAMLSDYMDEFSDDPRRGEIAHIGWGLNERARWSRLATAQRGFGMEARSFYGNVMFATGPNAELGGTNHSPCHLDIPMRGCSLELNGEPILKDGEFEVSELRRP